MKKLICLSLLAMVLLGGNCFAATSKNLISGDAGILTTTTSDSIKTRDYNKTTYFINYDETEVGGGVYVTITFQGSWDNSTWFDMNFNTTDTSVADTPDTSIVLAVDSKKIVFFQENVVLPYTRVKVVPYAVDSDDWAYVTVDFVGLQ